jgi:hypothetical protein
MRTQLGRRRFYTPRQGLSKIRDVSRIGQPSDTGYRESTRYYGPACDDRE